MVLLICPSSVNCCFKTLLRLQFLFSHSEIFTRKTRHIVPPCNKAGISNFHLEFQSSMESYSSFSSFSIRLTFFTRETRHTEPPCNIAGMSNSHLEFQEFQEFQISLKCYSSFLFFLPEKLGIQCHPVTKPELQISA